MYIPPLVYLYQMHNYHFAVTRAMTPNLFALHPNDRQYHSWKYIIKMFNNNCSFLENNVTKVKK